MHDRLYLRGKIWWGSYYTSDGKRGAVSTKCTDRTAATLALRRIEREEQGGKRGYVAVTDVLKNLETWVAENTSPENLDFVTAKCNALRTALDPNADVHKLTRQDLVTYIKTRQAVALGKSKKALSRYTIKREVKVFIQALSRANRDGLTKINLDLLKVDFPAPYVPRKRWLSREEFLALAAALSPPQQLWVWVAVYTGARKSEIESLQWSDLVESVLHVRGTKTEKSDRFIPLHPALKEKLGRAGKGSLVQPWANVQRDLKLACKRINIPNISPNDLRRTFASWLLQAGISNSVVAELLGHTTTQLVDTTYGKLSQGALLNAMNLLK